MLRREFLVTPLILAGCGMDVELVQSPLRRTTKNVFGAGVSNYWTPTFTASVPGDLAVVYNGRVGEAVRDGDNIDISFRLWADFTHTTASGDVRIGGLPYIISNESFAIYYGAFYFDGITKANYTQFTLIGVGDTAYMTITASGSAQAGVLLQVSDLTGGTLVFAGAMRYRTRAFS